MMCNARTVWSMASLSKKNKLPFLLRKYFSIVAHQIVKVSSESAISMDVLHTESKWAVVHGGRGGTRLDDSAWEGNLEQRITINHLMEKDIELVEIGVEDCYNWPPIVILHCQLPAFINIHSCCVGCPVLQSW